MKIEACGQPDGGPANKPRIENPVRVTLEIPVFYSGTGALQPVKTPIMCGRVFAETALAVMERVLKAHGKGLVHLGVYNARMARRKDGTPITPPRWSNHSFGCAIDWSGIATGDQWQSMAKLKDDPVVMAIRREARVAIVSTARKPEIVDEGGWIHVGFYPTG